MIKVVLFVLQISSALIGTYETKSKNIREILCNKTSILQDIIKISTRMCDKEIYRKLYMSELKTPITTNSTKDLKKMKHIMLLDPINVWNHKGLNPRPW